jgi:hypothetical protein
MNETSCKEKAGCYLTAGINDTAARISCGDGRAPPQETAVVILRNTRASFSSSLTRKRPTPPRPYSRRCCSAESCLLLLPLQKRLSLIFLSPPCWFLLSVYKIIPHKTQQISLPRSSVTQFPSHASVLDWYSRHVLSTRQGNLQNSLI